MRSRGHAVPGLIISGLALLCTSVFVGFGSIGNFVGLHRADPPQVAAAPSYRTAGGRSLTRVARGDGEEGRPSIPTSTEDMCKQAADASMRAYRDGYPRQVVTLRLDAAEDKKPMDFFQMTSKEEFAKNTRPIGKSYAQKLWEGDFLDELRQDRIDDDEATLYYRAATNPLQDAAVIYIPGQQLVTSQRIQGFFNQMKDRLVVLLNPESAVLAWRQEDGGIDFNVMGAIDQGAAVCKQFPMVPYYYQQLPLLNWETIIFRVYPHPWEIWVENLNFTLVKVGEVEGEEKPNLYQMQEMFEAYEAENKISQAKKIGKMLKDQTRVAQADIDVR